MKRLPHFLPVVFAALASATAQIPDPAPQPAGQAVVTGKSESDNGLSITLDHGRSRMSKSGQLRAAEVKAFRLLQVGRAYTFPDAFQVPGDDSAEFTQVPLLGLEKRSPFRALVDRVEVADDRVSLRLCCADGSKIEYLHSGAQDLAKAKSLVASLQPEETYEFPAVLEGKKPAAPPAGAEPLDQYVGDWRGTLDDDAAFFITMRCAWRADGQGLWREIMYDDSSGADPVYDIAIMTADAEGKKFLASDPRDANKLPATSSYDPATKIFTTRLPSFKVGVIRSNTATFTDANTITWKTLTRSDTGAVLSTTSGTYRRLTKKPVSDELAEVPSFGKPETLTALAESFTKAPPPNELLKLQNLPPFRATVLKRRIADDRIGLDLCISGHEPVAVEHTGQEDWDKALKLAERLREGGTYEFPDVTADAPVAPPADAPPAPATDAMRALQPFIGTWKDPAHPDKGNLNRFFWKADGTGLWRETTHSMAPPPADADTGGGAYDLAAATTLKALDEAPPLQTSQRLITYDARRQCYVESMPVALHRRVSIVNGEKTVSHTLTANAPAAKGHEGRWDAATQTYTWSEIRDLPQLDTKYSGTRRFVSPDRIEWTSRVTAADGKVIQENAGTYQRVAQ